MIQVTERDIKEAKEKKCCPTCKSQRFWRSIIGTQDFKFDENGRVFWRDKIEKKPIDPEIDKDHSCNDHIELSDDCDFKGDYLLAEGKCGVCKRKLMLLFEYVNTTDAETDEIIE